ncbi:MAG: dTMP kinase [Verrucomicrobia bacterium]|nr:MAG: dTMP kinase [Verrucomicrobiota bacterium]
MRQRGIFISFEGSEGCGKSTQIGRLAETLKARNIPFVTAREPGGTDIGENIRQLLKHADVALCPHTELFLFAASRAQLVREVFKPALLNGISVITDRYFDSTAVYQGSARSLPSELVECVNRHAVDHCIPDITFLLDMDAALALKRATERHTEDEPEDRLEQEPADFYERVREAYLQRAQHEPGRFVVLDAKRSVDALSQTILKTLETRWPFQLRTP